MYIFVYTQVAEEECGVAAANEMDTEPYFVDFMRDAPEITGNKSKIIGFLPINIVCFHPFLMWPGCD